MPRQLSLGLPFTVSYDPADFITGGCNQEAALLMRKRSEWSDAFLCVVGAAGSGKTHLCALFHAYNPTAFMQNPETLSDEIINEHRETSCFIIDNADKVKDETAFFHLLNLVRENKGALLMTAQSPPLEWRVTLPDLRSRLSSFSVTFLRSPDENFLTDVLLKLLSDRQIGADRDLIAQMVKYIRHDFHTVRETADLIDTGLYEIKRPLSLSVFKKIIAERRDLLSPYGSEKIKGGAAFPPS